MPPTPSVSGDDGTSTDDRLDRVSLNADVFGVSVRVAARQEIRRAPPVRGGSSKQQDGPSRRKSYSTRSITSRSTDESGSAPRYV